MSNPHFQLKLKRRIFNDAFYPLLKSKKRYNILFGGSNSGKSHFIAQMLLIKLLTEPEHRMLITRKVKNTLRLSAFQLIKDYVYRWKLDDIININKADMTITCEDLNASINFVGLDDTGKLMSIEGITQIWVEEAHQITQEDFEELNRRLRGKTKHLKQIWMSFNPVNQQLWQKRYFIDSADDSIRAKTLVHHSTILDNKFAPAEDLETLQLLRGTARKVFLEGQFGVPDQLILTAISNADQFPETKTKYYGIDFGFIAPMTLVETALKERTIYMQEHYYKTHTNIDDLIAFMDSNLDKRSSILIADSEDPAAIAQIKQAGYIVQGANKYKNSVVSSLKWMQQYDIKIVDDSPNLRKELSMLSWYKDKKTGLITEVVDDNGFDHAIDAARYVCLNVFMKQKISISFA